MKRVIAYIAMIVVSAGVCIQPMAARPAAAQKTRPDPQVVRISASTFEFTPSEIVVRRGMPVTLALISRDRYHGFRPAAFDVRADILPGGVQELRSIPDKTGAFTFFCDAFCGDGHEDMSGTLTVVEP